MSEGLQAYRDQFGADDGYLNFASYGPPSRVVADEAARLFEMAVAGVDATTFLHHEDQRALASAASLVGRDQSALHLISSTSLGLLQTAFAMPGGEVLVSAAEFPANVYPWRRAAQAGVTAFRMLAGEADDAVTPERVATHLTADVGALAVSAVDFRTGALADLDGLRDVIGDRLLVVDAIQGFGVADIPWEVADVVVVGGQKWVRAGWGTGFIAFSDRALDRLVPRMSSWTGVADPSEYDGAEHAPAPGAQRFSITNGSPFASGALAAALELIAETGVDAISGAIRAGTGYLIDALAAAGVAVLSPTQEHRRAGIVVAQVADAQAAHARLAHAGFTVTAHRPDRLRISVHATTPTHTLDAFVSALRGIR